jgi:hypothetical protein
VRPDTTPGAIWRYSGGGSSVAQLLMQDVTGVSFPELVRELVLGPAGMVHSGYEQPLPASRAGSAAVGHRMSGQPVAGRWHTYPEMFAAGLWTTPSDLARLALAVQRSYNGGPGILTPAMTQEMLRVQAGEYGLGFGVSTGDDWASFSHGGANEGYRALFFAFADRGQGAVVMTSGDGGSPLAAELLRAVAHEYDWPAQRALVRRIVPMAAARLAAMAGTWTGELGGRPVSLRLSADGATLRSAGWPLGERTLHHFGDDAFFHVEGTAVVRFEVAQDGAVTGAVLEIGGQVVRLSGASGRANSLNAENSPLARNGRANSSKDSAGAATGTLRLNSARAHARTLYGGARNRYHQGAAA